MAGKRLFVCMHLIIVGALVAGCAAPPAAAPTATARPAATQAPAATQPPAPSPTPESSQPTIEIDGQLGAGEWDAYEVNMVDGSDGHDKGDILEVRYFLDACFLYLLVTLENPTEFNTAEVQFSYGPRFGKIVVNLSTGSEFHAGGSSGTPRISPILLAGSIGDVFEVQVPLEEIDGRVDDIISVTLLQDNLATDGSSPNDRAPIQQYPGGQENGGCALPTAQNATTSGSLGGNETWSGEITLTGDVYVPAGTTLTIEPGTTVYLMPDSDDQACCGTDTSDPNWDSRAAIEINAVDGILIAEGTADQPIVFEPLGEPSGLLSLIFIEGQRASWDGLRVGRGSRITHARIANANIGVHIRACQTCEREDAERAATTVSHTQIEDSRRYGIAVNDTDAILIRNDINRAAQAAVAVSNAGNLTMTHNQVRNSAKGLQINNGSRSAVAVRNNLFIDNGTAIEAAEVADLEIANNTVALAAGAAGEWASGTEVVTRDTSRRGISVFPAARTRIVNNLIAGAFDWAIGVHDYPSESLQVAYNIYHAVAEPYAGQGQSIATTPVPGMDSGNLSADPLFVNGGGEEPDFHLSAGSPAIDAGAPDLLDPDGSPSDIGAYGGPEAAGWED